jgi:hypothetical protein
MDYFLCVPISTGNKGTALSKTKRTTTNDSHQEKKTDPFIWIQHGRHDEL